MKKIKVCEICGATNDEKQITHCAINNMYLCQKHLAQIKKYNKITDPTKRTVKDKNEIILYDDYAEIIIRNQTNEIIAKTIIDLEDVDKVSSRKWNLLPCKSGVYVYSRSPHHVKLHRFILGYNGPMEIDHINRNTMDNRKSNLRIVTRSENASNNAAKHVYKRGNSWVYEIVKYGKRFKMGGFKSQKEAQTALQACLNKMSERVDELIKQFNQKKVTDQYKGVQLHYGKYRGVYNYKGEKYSTCSYSTPEEAYKARMELIKNISSE